jgi:hypothetical protein
MAIKPGTGKKNPLDFTERELERWLDSLEDANISTISELIPELVMFLPKGNATTTVTTFEILERLATASRQALHDAVTLGLPRSLQLLLLRDEQPFIQNQVLEFLNFVSGLGEETVLGSLVISNLGPYLLRLVKRGVHADATCRTLNQLCALDDDIREYFISLGMLPVIIVSIRSGRMTSDKEEWVDLIGAIADSKMDARMEEYVVEEFRTFVALLLTGLTATHGLLFSQRCATLRKLCRLEAPLAELLDRLDDDRTIIKDIVQRIAFVAKGDAALDKEAVQAQEAAAGFLGDLASFEDSLGTDLLIEAGALPLFTPALKSDSSSGYLKKELCYTLSNVAAGTDTQRQAILSEPGLVECILARAKDPVSNVRTEALYAARNLIVEDNEISQLVDAGIIGTLVEGMVWAKEKLQKELILSIECVLEAEEAEQDTEKAGSSAAHSEDVEATIPPKQGNRYVRLFREKGGVEALKTVKVSSSAAKSAAEDVLRRFFPNEVN